MKYLKKPAHMAVWKVVILDILLAGLILVIFAFFHHALPAWITRYELEMSTSTEPPKNDSTEPPVTQQQEPSTEGETVGSGGEDTTEGSEETTEPDNRTEWQKRFEEHFTDEVVITENSYSSPQVSVTIETVSYGEGKDKVTYHVADIYVASLDNFITYTAHGQMKYFDTQDVTEMVSDSNAILAISGDFLTYQKSGFLMRNGDVYVSDRNYSICVLFADGTMETYDSGTYNIDDILARDPLQVWSFGPVLLDADGTVRDSYDVSTSVSYRNPRSAVGYYEPGHYCFIVVDGRQEGYSKGLLISELAQIFEDLGCACAYNLDGGGSAVMMFDGEKYSSQSNGGGRDLGDILVITDSLYAPGEGGSQ